MSSGAAGLEMNDMRQFSRCTRSRINSQIFIDWLLQYGVVALEVAVLICIVSILHGCYPLVGGIEIQGDNELQLSGVWDSLKQSTEEQPVRMLYIHGMGIYHSTEFVEPFANRFTEKLGLTLKGCKENTLQTEAKSPRPGGQSPHALLSVCTYTGSQNRTLMLYTVLWSPLTEEIKKDVLGYDSAAIYEGERAFFSKTLKKDVMNDSLSDPLLYLSPNYQNKLRVVMQQAICFVASRNDDCATTKPTLTGIPLKNSGLFVITESLGSTMLYDTLKRIYRSGDGLKAAGEKLLRDSVVHYMFANQLPLLCLGRYNDDHGPGGRHCIDEGGTTKILSYESQDKPFKIVAFSDPNDLLSYPLKKQQFKDFSENKSVEVTNVLLHVEKWAFMGLAYPHTAHTGHRESPDVLQIIACGIDNKKPKKCKPAPTLAGGFRP